MLWTSSCRRADPELSKRGWSSACQLVLCQTPWQGRTVILSRLYGILHSLSSKLETCPTPWQNIARSKWLAKLTFLVPIRQNFFEVHWYSLPRKWFLNSSQISRISAKRLQRCASEKSAYIIKIVYMAVVPTLVHSVWRWILRLHVHTTFLCSFNLHP